MSRRAFCVGIGALTTPTAAPLMEPESESGVSPTRGDDGAAAVRELRRLYELTEKLEAESMRVLRGDAAALPTLPEVHGAITACLSVVRSPGDASALRAFADSLSVFRSRTRRDRWMKRSGGTGTALTAVPHFDGHLRRKYGMKPVLGCTLPRNYYRCIYLGERDGPASKTRRHPNNGSPSVREVNDRCGCNVCYRRA